MLNYCIVKQRIGAITEDTPDDDDRYPDYTSVFGQVVFAPTMTNGSAYKITDDDGVVHTVPATRITAQIINGEISHEGVPGLPLFAAGPNANPSTIVYTATYTNLTAAGQPITLNNITFRAVPGETIDLSSYTPVAGAPTPGIIQGPPGHTPFIGQNGNWWINGKDTDVAATSPLVHSYTELTEAFEENTMRVKALEAMNGVTPESPVDGQTANLMTQPGTLTRAVLDQSFVQAPIDLTGRGVSHTATAAHNTQTIRDAIAEAAGTGRQILLPATPPGEWIDINGSLVIPGGMSVLGHGIDRTRIRQMTRMEPMWDVQGPDVDVSGFTGMHTTNTPAGSERDIWRGEPGTFRLAVVRTNSDRVTIHDVKGVNSNSVAQFYSWNISADTKGPPLRGCAAWNLIADECVFGLLVAGVDGFYFNNIRGSYLLRPGFSTSPHLVYFTDSRDPNVDVQGGNCHAWDGRHSNAFQFKGMRGGRIKSLIATRCLGLMNLMDNHDTVYSSITSVDDTSTGTNYGSITMQDVNSDVTLDDVTVRMSANGKPVRIVGGTTNTHIKNLRVTSNHTAPAASGSTAADVDISGEGNVVEDVYVENVGSVEWTASIMIFSGTGCRVIRPRTSGAQFGFVVSGTSFDTSLEDYTLQEIMGNERSISTAGKINHFPRYALGSPAMERKLLLMEEGWSPGGSAGTTYYPQVGPIWQRIFGTWAVRDGIIRTTSVAQDAFLVADVGVRDVTIQATVTYARREALAVRVTSRDDFLTARINAGALEIAKKTGGSMTTVLASTPFTPTEGSRYRLRFEAAGDRLRATIGDGLVEVDHVLSEEDMAQYTATSHGLHSQGHLDGGYNDVIIY